MELYQSLKFSNYYNLHIFKTILPYGPIFILAFKLLGI